MGIINVDSNYLKSLTDQNEDLKKRVLDLADKIRTKEFVCDHLEMMYSGLINCANCGGGSVDENTFVTKCLTGDVVVMPNFKCASWKIPTFTPEQVLEKADKGNN